MPKNCISIYNEFTNIGPTRRTWTWRIKVKVNGVMSYLCFWEEKLFQTGYNLSVSD